MKLTKDTIKKLNKENIKIHINVIEEIDLNKLVGQEINELSGKDFENTIKNKQKNYFYTINDEEYYTTSAFKSLLNAVQSKIAQDNKQDEYGMNQEFDGYDKYDENNNVKECHCEHCTCKKELHLNNEFNMDGFVEFLKDSPVDDIPCVTIENKPTDDIPYIAIESTGEPSFYQENNFVKIHDKIINLRKILDWEENAVYYVPDKLAFYKIKDNSLYQKDIQITGDYFNLINEKYSQELFEILENSIKDEDCNHLKNLSDYIKSVKNIEPKTIEEVWNKLIEIEKRDNNFCWNYHNNLEQRIKKEKNLINYIQAIYLCAYGELQDNTLVIKFKDIQKPLKYNIEKNEITLMRYFVNNNIKEVKNYAELIGCTEHEFKDLISAVKQLNPEDIPKDYIPCEKLKKIVNHFYDLYKDAISYFSVGYNIDNDYDEILPLVDFIKKHKKEVSKELLEDAILYDEDNLKWCKKHELRYEY